MNENIFFGIDIFLLAYFLGLNSLYIFLLIATNPNLFHRLQERRIQKNFQIFQIENVPPITIIIPCFNDSSVLMNSISSALNVDFPYVSVIVVDDGSSDQTLQKLIDLYQLVLIPPAYPSSLKTEKVNHYYRSKINPKLTVIHKENGGREDSINAGINASTSPFFVNMDADSMIEPNALSRLAQHLLTEKNICAMGGMLTIINGCEVEDGKIKKVGMPDSFWGSMQVVEYLKTFFFGRLGWNQVGGTPLISGGFGLFSKQAILDVGGFQKILAGDLDITLAIHKSMRDQKKKYRIDYVFDSVVWTDVPQTYSALAIQRKRWHCSVIEVCWRRKYMFFNPKYGVIGFLHLPYIFFGEGMGPLVEGFGYLYVFFCIAVGKLHLIFFVYLILIAWGVNLFLAIAALIMQEIFLKKYISWKFLIRMLFLSLIENVTYRPITVWWRIVGFFQVFTKKRSMYTRGKRPQEESI